MQKFRQKVLSYFSFIENENFSPVEVRNSLRCVIERPGLNYVWAIIFRDSLKLYIDLSSPRLLLVLVQDFPLLYPL